MKRPWNIIDCPVYSLATYVNNSVNMNVCTYVTGISMQPKLYGIAIYHNTQTFENLENSDTAVLQLLHKNHLNIIRFLGKRSGKQTDKKHYLEKKQLLDQWHKYDVLKNAPAYLLLKKVSRINVNGDHDFFCFKVEKFKTVTEDGILMFQDLIKNKIIL